MERNKSPNRSKPLPYLRTAREARGVGFRELARRTGVSRDTLFELEAGRRGAYKSTVQKFADALGCEPWQLTGINPWEMTDQERKAFNRLMESGGIPQTFVVKEEDDTDT